MQKSKDKFIGYIYCITNKVNKKKYVGQTRKSVSERWSEHKWDTLNRPGDDRIVFHQALRKYGFESFVIETIDTVVADSREQLKEKLNQSEEYYIKTIGTLIPLGYNMTPGGYQVVDSVKVPVFQFDLSGNLLQMYDSYADAERNTGVCHRHIHDVCDPSTRRCNAGGFLWSLTNVPPVYKPFYREGYTRSVLQKDDDGNIINRFDSITDAASALDLHIPLITKCCKGERKTTGGYHWSYAY